MVLGALLRSGVDTCTRDDRDNSQIFAIIALIGITTNYG